jgi:hypothetical protein
LTLAFGLGFVAAWVFLAELRFSHLLSPPSKKASPAVASRDSGFSR